MFPRSKSMLVLATACLTFGGGSTRGDEPPRKPAEKQAATQAVPDRAQLEKEFAESLSGAVLVGTYSVTGRENGANDAPKTERYTISKVTKLKDDLWLFQARIQYGKTDLDVPITLEIKWAGDTPVITMTDMTIPALGTFTSRVMFYRGRYAGTWQHDKVGGHLWGTIEKPKPNDRKKAAEPISKSGTTP